MVPAGVGQQQGYAVGAAVYDNSHKASRGWGTIKAAAAADPADGTPRWQVQFERGQRTTAIKQSYLALPCMPCSDRVAPAAAGQRIMVVVGEHSGKEGVTAAFNTTKACTQLHARHRCGPSHCAMLHPHGLHSAPELCRASMAGCATWRASTAG